MAVYVDKDKIKQELLNKAEELQQVESFDAVLRTAAIYMALLYLELAKSEAVVPVIHAHWIPIESTLHVEKSGACSYCGEAWPISDTEYFYCCPNCGSIMDEEVD